MLAGVAAAALMGLSLPASAATSPSLPGANYAANDGAVASFYASRGAAPLWLGNSSAANELVKVLQHAALDGFENGPAVAAQAQALLARATSGDVAARTSAEHLLSTAWVG